MLNRNLKDYKCIRTMKTEKFERSFQIRAEKVDEKNREIEFSFSSEEPVRRWFWELGEWGLEILDHNPDSVRMERLKTKAPLLKAHSRQQWLGKVIKAWIDNDQKLGFVRVKFHQSEEEEFKDVVDGTKDSVSFGYAVHSLILESISEDDGPVYRAFDWEPFEVSLEPTPADITVGPERELVRKKEDEVFETKVYQRISDIPDAKTSKEEIPAKEEKKMEAKVTDPDLEKAQESAIDKVRKDELARMDAIQKIASKYEKKVPQIGEFARTAIDQKLSVEQFEAMAIPVLDATKTEVFAEDGKGTNDVGLSKKEIKEFRLTRLLAAMSFGAAEPELMKAAEFELEACKAAAEISTRKEGSSGMPIPAEVLRAPSPGNFHRGAQIVGAPLGMGSRDMSAGGATTGADFIQTSVDGGSMIDFLRDMSVFLPRATVLRGLVGNLAVPRITAGVTGAWTAEGIAPAEQTPTIDQMQLSPKTVLAFVDVTRKLLMQASIDVEAWLRREFGASFSVTLENGGITDDGGDVNRPEGILGISGTVQHNTAGTYDWSHAAGYEANVALGSALDGDLAFLTNPKVAHLSKTTAKDAGSGKFLQEAREMNGYPVLVTNQVPSDLGAGSDSAQIFGNMKAAVFAVWEELSIIVDPFTQASAGIVRLTGQMEADFDVRQPSAFSVAEDITTTL